MFVQKHFGKSLQHSLIQSHEAFAFPVASRPLAVSSLISGVGEDISLSGIKKWPLPRMLQIFRPFSIAILKERTPALPPSSLDGKRLRLGLALALFSFVGFESANTLAAAAAGR